MGYRDGLEAAQARIASLDSELEEARSRIASLESDLEAARDRVAELEKTRSSARPAPPERRPPLDRLRARPEPGPSRRFGAIHHHPPRTYLPFLRLWSKSVEATWVRRPVLRRPSSEAIWRWVLHYGLIAPLTYGIRLPLYYPTVCLGLALTAVICCALTILTVPFIFLSRFSFSANPPEGESGWWHGDPSIEVAASFLWLVLAIPLSLSVVGIPLMFVTSSLPTEKVRGETWGPHD